MKIFNTLSEWRLFRQSLPQQHDLGFVPTMGNLHKAHASLVQKSLNDNHLTLVSLFINPTQFNNPDDFKHYPKTIEEDIALLQRMNVDFCLIPEKSDLYPDDYRYRIEEQQLSLMLEGVDRPGHFTGMLTVVMKLLQLAKPKRAYFGEKDQQQLQLIQGMVDAFFMDVALIPCPIVRETSGLAYSSRNQRLSPLGRQTAEHFAQIFQKNIPCSEIKNQLNSLDLILNYLEEHDGIRYIAITIEGVRLIDNKKII